MEGKGDTEQVRRSVCREAEAKMFGQLRKGTSQGCHLSLEGILGSSLSWQGRNQRPLVAREPLSVLDLSTRTYVPCSYPRRGRSL